MAIQTPKSMTMWTQRSVLTYLLACAAHIDGTTYTTTISFLRNLDGSAPRTGKNFQLHLKSNPSMVADGGDVVITWDGHYQAADNDTIALVCGPMSQKRDFLRKFKVKEVLEPNSKNSVRFDKLVMLRCDYVVMYYGYSDSQTAETYPKLGQVKIPMKESPNAPKHGHLAFSSALDQMVLMFNSASNEVKPMVQYGESASQLSSSASGSSTTYRSSDMCDFPATMESQGMFRDPGFMHKVKLSNLKLNTEYYYRFGNEKHGWSSVRSFRSRPGPSSKETKFIAYGDMGVSPASRIVASRILKEVTSNGFESFVLHFGDISYAFGRGFVWDEFFHMIEPIATRVPYMVSIGNHEYDYKSHGSSHDPSGGGDGKNGGMAFQPSWGNFGDDSFGECSVPTYHRFHTPENGNSIYWYSFVYGGVFVVQISSEHDWRKGSVQYKWLEKELSQVDRKKTPWILLTTHRMMYTSQREEDADLFVATHMREELESLLYQYKVNIVFCGHQHSYERIGPTKGGQCVKQGTVHVVAGTAGADLETGGFGNEIGKCSVRHVQDYGYLKIHSTEKKMRVQFVLSESGKVFDDFEILPWP